MEKIFCMKKMLFLLFIVFIPWNLFGQTPTISNLISMPSWLKHDTSLQSAEQELQRQRISVVLSETENSLLFSNIYTRVRYQLHFENNEINYFSVFSPIETLCFQDVLSYLTEKHGEPIKIHDRDIWNTKIEEYDLGIVLSIRKVDGIEWVQITYHFSTYFHYRDTLFHVSLGFLFPNLESPPLNTFLNFGIGSHFTIVPKMISPGIYTELGIGLNWHNIGSKFPFWFNAGARFYNLFDLSINNGYTSIKPFIGYNLIIGEIDARVSSIIHNPTIGLSLRRNNAGIEFIYHFPSNSSDNAGLIQLSYIGSFRGRIIRR
jgi:hypothetical protein